MCGILASSRGQAGPLTSVVDLSGAGVDSLEKLIDLLVRHLLAQVRQDVLELADADEPRHVLVEDLETSAVLLGLAWVAEAAWAVQHALEGLEVDCSFVEKRTISLLYLFFPQLFRWSDVWVRKPRLGRLAQYVSWSREVVDLWGV